MKTHRGGAPGEAMSGGPAICSEGQVLSQLTRRAMSLREEVHHELIEVVWALERKHM